MIDRWVKVKLEESKFGKETLHVSGMDKLGGTYELFQKVGVDGASGASHVLKEAQMKENTFAIDLTFQGHYNENKLKLKVPR